jgi:hypothetical protein
VPSPVSAAFRRWLITAASPGFAEYQANTARLIPVFELQPAG